MPCDASGMTGLDGNVAMNSIAQNLKPPTNVDSVVGIRRWRFNATIFQCSMSIFLCFCSWHMACALYNALILSVTPPSCPNTQAFKALGNEAKAGMLANKNLRDEMALQEVGQLNWEA